MCRDLADPPSALACERWTPAVATAPSRRPRSSGERPWSASTLASDWSRERSPRAGSRGLVADVCQLAVRDQTFDVVISSEMLEHTDAPERAIKELARVLRADGLLVLTTPNRVWQGVVRAASRLRLRPFRGLENFVAWRRLERSCAAAGLEILVHIGFHPWPFHLGLNGTARMVERHLARGRLARLMVNQAVVARRRSSE